MALERSKGIPKANAEGVKFSMRRSDGGHLDYMVERGALEFLAGRFLAVDEMHGVFLARRQEIERIVREKEAAGALEQGRVIVRAHDVQPPSGKAAMRQVIIYLPKAMVAEIESVAGGGSSGGSERNEVIRELLAEALEARRRQLN